MVSEFKLQCSTWKISIVDGMFFAGVLIGASVLGYLSDKIGKYFSVELNACLTFIRATECDVLLGVSQWLLVYLYICCSIVLVVFDFPNDDGCTSFYCRDLKIELVCLLGVGSGGAGLTAFVLTSEFLGPSKRGRLLIALQIFATGRH